MPTVYWLAGAVWEGSLPVEVWTNVLACRMRWPRGVVRLAGARFHASRGNYTVNAERSPGAVEDVAVVSFR